MELDQEVKIGIVGTGFIGKGLRKVIEILPDMTVSSILTQRNLDEFNDESMYTNSVHKLIDTCDLVVECNGNPIYATEILYKVLDAGIPVVTLDAELHITAGSYLSTRGLITEAEGDQPGALAALKEDLVSIGFTPLVYGNLKGFLNHNPNPEEMAFWAKKQGISTRIVTSATDGTKVQIEQALVANGLGALVARQGLYGYECVDIEEDAKRLALRAKEINQPISDYLLKCPQAKGNFPKGVFITAEYDQSQASVFEYLHLGKGPFYTLIKNYFLCHIEVPRTIRQVMRDNSVLLDNSSHPTASVCGIAKHDLNAGTKIDWDNRAFHVRGEAISIENMPNHVPIGLMNDAVISRKVGTGQILEFDDVEIPETKAYDAYRYMLNLVK